MGKKKGDSPYYPSMFKDPHKRPSSKGRVLVVDTEAIGLEPDMRYDDPTCTHVISCKDKETGEVFQFFDPYDRRDKKHREWLDAEGTQAGFLLDGIKFLNGADVLIGQNWLGYDIIALDKVFPGKLKLNYWSKPRGGKGRRGDYPFRVMDTMVMSQLLNPERKPPAQAYSAGRGNVGPHSIEAHGWRMGRPKPENEDWSKLTDHMLFRCSEDAEIGDDFYDFLMDEWYEQSAPSNSTGLTIEDAYRLEATLVYQMARQEQRGFRIDLNWAWELVQTLDKHSEDIIKRAMPNMPLKLVKKKLNHTTLRTAAVKAGKTYELDQVEYLEVLKPLGPEQYEKVNKKGLKAWVKAGGKKKGYIKRRYKVEYKKGEITHGADRATLWNVTVKNGNYSAAAKKDYPQWAIGNIADFKDPVVCGPYTPIKYEEITLGNRDIVRQTLHIYGWRGVNPTKSEEEYLEEHGELPHYYAGKLDQDSIHAWEARAEERGEEVPAWCKDILTYYVVIHRRGQILNKGDMDYYAENGQWPKQPGGQERKCRGLVAVARDSSSGKSFQQLMEKFGLDYWYKKRFRKDDEFRVPAAATSIGTNTFRMRHKYVVNIPSRGLYGKEMRRLFIASKGYVILGCDGAGLELRMLSHFMNDPHYEEVILSGDIHSHNQEMAGLPTRDMAKTFIYAFLYGAGIPKLAMGCGMPESKMREKVDQFLASLPMLKELLEDVQEVARERGYVKAVDGRLGRIRKSGGKVKEHTALNVLLQMTGSLCMKWGLYIALKYFHSLGIDARLVANQHDEVQMEIPESEVELLTYKINKEDWKTEEKRVVHHENGGYFSAPSIVGETKKGKLVIERKYHKAGDVLCKSFEEAGSYLKIRTPLAGEYKIGRSWEQTH